MAPPYQVGYDDSANNSQDRIDDQRWLKMFPECVFAKDKSTQFMTRAMFVAFSMILDRRRILPKEYFSLNYITENIKVKSLSFNYPKSLKIAEYIRNAGDAIKMGYLQELALVLSNNEKEEEAFEIFSFTLHYYPDGGVAAQMTSSKSDSSSGESNLIPVEKLEKMEYEGTPSVRAQLVLLAKSVCVLCQKVLTPLDPKFSANFRVKFTDETPADYEIGGFKSAPYFYKPPADTQMAVLGQLRPGHHGGLMVCMSKHIDDSYRAEHALKRQIDKAARELGFTPNNTLYASFADPNTTTFSEPSPQASTPSSQGRPETRRGKNNTHPYKKEQNPNAKQRK